MTGADGLSRRALLGAGLRRLAEERRLAPAPRFRDWGENDPVGLGAWLAPVAADLLAAGDVRADTRVLVTPGGDGVLATAAARVRAEVNRAPDGECDAVLSLFGVSHHADPRTAAAQLARAARPGAPICFTAWSGLMADVLRAVGPPAAQSERWTRYETAYRHFFDFPDLDVVPTETHWRFASREEAIEVLARPATSAGAEEAVCAALPDLLDRYGESDGDAFVLRATYATVVARRP